MRTPIILAAVVFGAGAVLWHSRARIEDAAPEGTGSRYDQSHLFVVYDED